MSEQHTNSQHTTNAAVGGSDNGTPVVAPDLLAQAAQILGVDTSAGSPSEHSNLLLVTVAGPDAHKVVRVPLDVPAGHLARTLGDAVGVTVVARLSVRGGKVIRPAQTLAEVGIRTGSVIVVDEPGSPGLSETARSVVTDGAQQYWSRSPARRGRQETPPGRTGGQWALLGGSVVAMVVVVALAGAALFGGSSTTSAAPTAVSLRAADAWLAAKPFAGGRLGGVPADLGRSGAALNAVLEPAGSSSAAGITSQQFIVVPRAGTAFGLSVVTYRGKIAYPPTVTGLPFADGARTRTVPESGKIVRPSAAKAAQAWAQSAFGPDATGAVAKLGFGLAGEVRVLNQWQPKSGPAFVARIQVPLSSTAAGTPAARAAGALSAIRHTVATERNTLGPLADAIVADQATLASADTTAQAAVAAAGAAKPPNPPPLAAAATAAQQAATNAQNALTKDQHALTAARAKLAGDQKTEATDAAALKAAATQPATVVSVYDVAFTSSGTALTWVPADYLIGQS